VCILQGPIAAKWSIVKDEPEPQAVKVLKDLLGNINKALIQRLPERNYGDKSAVPTIDYLWLCSNSTFTNDPGSHHRASAPSVTLPSDSQNHKPDSSPCFFHLDKGTLLSDWLKTKHHWQLRVATSA
jgi:fatty acid synthase subunit beta